MNFFWWLSIRQEKSEICGVKKCLVNLYNLGRFPLSFQNQKAITQEPYLCPKTGSCSTELRSIKRRYTNVFPSEGGWCTLGNCHVVLSSLHENTQLYKYPERINSRKVRRRWDFPIQHAIPRDKMMLIHIIWCELFYLNFCRESV